MAYKILETDSDHEYTYRVRAAAILLTDLDVKYIGVDLFMLVEKNCINLLYEDIIMRQWMPNNPYIIKLYFEEGTTMRLKENEVVRMQEFFNYTNYLNSTGGLNESFQKI